MSSLPAITTLSNLIYDQHQQFAKVSADPSIEFEREAQFAIQLLQGNNYLAGTAMNNQDSLRNAVLNVAAIGISLNPARKQAYLVPRDGRVCLDISYIGMMHLAQQCGAIRWGQAVIVRKNDEFMLQQLGLPPIHKYDPFAQNGERGDIVGVYVVVKTDDGDFLTHPMPIAAVFKIRNRSTAWKAYAKDNSKSCPWVSDEEEMIKKTCVKQAAKYWPHRDRLDAAIHNLNTELEEGIDVDESATQEQVITMPSRKAEMKDVTPQGDGEPSGQKSSNATQVNNEARQSASSEQRGANADGECASASQVRLIKAKMAAAALSDTDLEKRFAFHIDAIPKSCVNDVLKWIANPMGGA